MVQAHEPQVSAKYYRRFPNQKVLCLRMKEIGILGAIRFDIFTRTRKGRQIAACVRLKKKQP